MHIREDEIERIAIDRFTSTSGKYLSILTSRFERGRTAFDIVVLDASNKKVRKIVRIAYDSQVIADSRWIEWKQAMTAPSQEEEQPDEINELELPTLEEARKDLITMPTLKIKARGARLFVRDIQPVDEYTIRAEAAGIIPVVAEQNKPRPTMGIIVAVGEDPLAQELYRIGDVVMFSKHSGSTFQESSVQYRSLELHEIIGVRAKEDGLSDLVIPDGQTDPSQS